MQTTQALIALCKTMLTKAGINPASTIEYEVNGEPHAMTLQQIIEAYMQASPAAQETFVLALKKAVANGPEGIRHYFEKMGQLLLITLHTAP